MHRLEKFQMKIKYDDFHKLLHTRILRVRMSLACHDPDFDLAKGSHHVAKTLRIDSSDLRKEITNTMHNLYRIK